MYKIEIEYKNINDKGTIILSSGGIEVDNIILPNDKEGMVLVNILKNLTAWMKKNIIKSIEIIEE